MVRLQLEISYCKREKRLLFFQLLDISWICGSCIQVEGKRIEFLRTLGFRRAGGKEGICCLLRAFQDLFWFALNPDI